MTSPLDPAAIVALLQPLPAGLFFIHNGVMVWCNETMSRITGIPLARAIGTNFVELVAPEDRPMVVDRYRRRLAGEQVPDTYEFSLLGEDGRRTPVAMVARVVEHEGARYSIGVVVDSTAHAQVAAGMTATDLQIPPAPVLRVAAGVLVVPLVGRFHAARAQALLQDCLAAVSTHSARALILDLTGLVDADLRVADYVTRTASATRLLGARCLLAGVSPALAQALATSDSALAALQTAATLEDALHMVQRTGPG